MAKRKSLFIIFLLILLLPVSLIFGGCDWGHNDSYIEPNIRLNLPNTLHVEYSSGAILVKDGNEYYVKASTVYSSDRLEVYAKVDLTNPVILDDPIYAQGYITARWAYMGGDNYVWQCATDDTNYSPWHANDHNYHVYATAEYFLRTGYSDINMPYEMQQVTITQLANETLTIGGNQVECVVWQYVYDNNDDLYELEKFWFEKDTHVFIKMADIFDPTDDIDADENVSLVATKFTTTESMETALAGLTEPRTKYVFTNYE